MAGFYQGLPDATLPLTGNEVAAFDTLLSGGANPQTEKISVQQLNTYVGTSPIASSVINFLAYSPESEDFTGDVTTVLQNFLLECQLIAYQLKDSGLDDQGQRIFVTAYIPRGRWMITSPLIIPELVNLQCDGLIVRNGSSGTITNNYTGDTTSKALANIYQPTVIVTPRSHCCAVNIYSNNDGTHAGAGMHVGKNWTVNSFTIGSAGSGYQVGDVLTCANPSKAPYIAATATVSTVSSGGGIMGVSVTEAGAYALPQVLQEQQWMEANGFNVFDTNGCLLTTGGSGTGATLNPTWKLDWPVATTTYTNGRGGLITDTILEHIRIAQVPTTTDATYGQMMGITIFGLNFYIADIEVQGGVNGINFNFCSDVRAVGLNSVASTNAVVISGGSNIVATDVVIDTPKFYALYINKTQGHYLQGRVFNRNVINYAGLNNYTIAIGLESTDSSGQNVEGLSLDFQMTNAGSGTTGMITAGNPALYLAHIKGSKINLNITNYTTVSTPSPITSFIAFGTSVDASNLITGSIDQVIGSLFSGSIAPCGVNIWDSSINGFCGSNSIYSIQGSGVPTNGGSGTGVNKAAPMSQYIDFTNGNIYYNTNTLVSPTWTQLTIS